MKSNFKHKIVLFNTLIFMFSILLTGCYDKTELFQVALVNGIGVDKVSDDNFVLVTLELASPYAAQLEEGALGKTNNSIIVTGGGETVYDAIRHISKSNSVILDFAHIKTIILSENYCETSISEFLDFAGRNRQFRNINWVLVSDGTANNIIKSRMSTKDITSIGLSDMMTKLQKEEYIFPVNLNSLIISLENQSKSAVVPLISIGKSEINPQGKIEVDRTAIIKKDKLIGTLSHDESKSYMWLSDKKTGTVVVNPIKSEVPNRKVTVLIKKKFAKVVPYMAEDGIHFKIQCFGTAEIKETENFLITKESIDIIERNTETILKHQLSSLIEKLQHEFNADVIGFAESIYINDPKTWFKIEDHWNEMFPDAKYEINFNIELKRIGMIKNNPLISDVEETER